ncbi:MAG: hypothetical protein KGJ87_04550 [Planctomycetota bacterium]|nr:hypothetical protein [Planctomycetota bacterium]MDE1889031.1 hypothetical protein [Planctomycetota bacterium]MDE2216417.1 hypothetical protein [Planctomycetota bacterium]
MDYLLLLIPEEVEMIDCTGCAGCDYDTCRRENTMRAEISSLEGQAPELVISELIPQGLH